MKPEDAKYLSLEDAFMYFTECQMATVQDLSRRSKFPKGELERHKRIQQMMLDVVQAHKLTPKSHHLLRLVEDMKNKAEPNND